MKTILLMWGLIALLAILSGCSKLNKKEAASQETRINIHLLPKYQWIIANQKAVYQEHGLLKLYPLPEPDFCQQDDVFEFFDDGKFMINEGRESCINPPPPETNEPLIVSTGFWSCARDTLTIQRSEGDVLTYRIEVLTPAKLVLVQHVTFPNGLVGTVKQIFRTVEKNIY